MMTSHFLSLFEQDKIPDTPPIWMMRQAGRYLPEYKNTRADAGSFLELCYNPELACEVTLQPLRRYAFDAAILFADILLIPQALGQKLWFAEGEGPRLTPITNADSLNYDNFDKQLAPIYKTVSLLKKHLPEEKALIGFAGSPFTVASYMIAGRGTQNQAPAHALMQKDESAFQSIIDIVTEATIDYLAAQVGAGAQVLQLFDSWASSLVTHATPKDLEKYCFEANQKIIDGVRRKNIQVPIIGFPRAIGPALQDFVQAVEVDAIGLDQSVNLESALHIIPEKIVTQGNLDPQILVQGGEKLTLEVEKILEQTKTRKHIFNLGHGIVPQTPPENVAQVLQIVKGC